MSASTLNSRSRYWSNLGKNMGLLKSMSFRKNIGLTRFNNHSGSSLPPNEMIDNSSKKDEDDCEGQQGRVFPIGRSSLVDDQTFRESPSSSSPTKHVVIVMDAMEEFSMEPLEWALLNIIKPGYVVTLLGVMPWLNVPLSCKTWLDIWTINLDGLFALSELKEQSEWKNDTKYQKIRGIIELCDKFGVVPYMKIAMGFPLRLVVLEHTTSLHATWVVFDRHHRKEREFFAERIPSNIMMMNNEGEFDMLKSRSMIKDGETNTPEASPASRSLVAKVIISDRLREFFKNKEWKWTFQRK